MRLSHEDRVSAAVGDVFAALGRTLAFRRWPLSQDEGSSGLPRQGTCYSYRTGTVSRVGRVVEVVRPVGLTLKEVLHDPPCRVVLTMRWRIEPVASGCIVRLRANVRLSRASILRAKHWNYRLSQHFQRQFTHLVKNLEASTVSELATRKNVI